MMTCPVGQRSRRHCLQRRGLADWLADRDDARFMNEVAFRMPEDE